MTKANEDNAICISGEVSEAAQLDHQLYGEAFYMFTLSVPRLSGAKDELPVTLPARACAELPRVGARVRVWGQLRSYNKPADTGNRLLITVFARTLELAGPAEPPQNEVTLSGYVCKPVVFRTTPFMREIGDMLLAVNRSYNKSDYLPCIAWGRQARFAKDLPVGAKVRITGRLQSRVYQKVLPEGQVLERVAYEVSCAGIEQLGAPLMDRF
ncbi:MAG: single-stranded DNA-binding protein [Christensenellaceae bacterium]|jgi:single-stranded DNA-binding protein|nr:single-stranded DNA-binding protein [Christensenellaceae bacterium]